MRVGVSGELRVHKKEGRGEIVTPASKHRNHEEAARHWGKVERAGRKLRAVCK